MEEPLTSIVLPVHNQADHIGRILEGYAEALSERLPTPAEFVVVANACDDDSAAVCAELGRSIPRLRVIEEAESGWGRAVRAGLAEARGDVLCYTNSARTTAETLVLMLTYAWAYPHVALKANRRLRDSFVRRAGSLLYNLECRLLFDLPTWDVNGTPKVFPRSFAGLTGLSRNDDLIDAEFGLICRRRGYPMVEVPVHETVRHGGKSTTRLGSAWRMYLGAYRLRREIGPADEARALEIGTGNGPHDVGDEQPG